MFNKRMPLIRILYVKIRMNRIWTENQGVLWFWHGRFIKHFYGKSQNGGRFSGEDDNKCKKKCTFAARSVFWRTKYGWTDRDTKPLWGENAAQSAHLICKTLNPITGQTYTQIVWIYEQCYCKIGIVIPGDDSQQWHKVAERLWSRIARFLSLQPTK